MIDAIKWLETVGALKTGQKPDDAQAADACFVCHEIVDGRMQAPEFTKEEIRLMHAEGVLRTQEARRQEAA